MLWRRIDCREMQMAATLRHGNCRSDILVHTGKWRFAQIEVPQGVIELTLPRPVSSNEKVRVEVRTRALPKRAEIRVTAPDGTLFGTISP